MPFRSHNPANSVGDLRLRPPPASLPGASPPSPQMLGHTVTHISSLPLSQYPSQRRIYLFIYFKDFIYLFLNRGEGREKEGEEHQCVVASTGDLAGNPGMCPAWESNLRPFGSQAGAQSTEPHQPGHNPGFKEPMGSNYLHKGDQKKGFFLKPEPIMSLC